MCEDHRTKLLDYCRRGKPWSCLTGPSSSSTSPISSRRDSLAHYGPDCSSEVASQVRHDHPELVSALAEVGHYAGMAPSSTTRHDPDQTPILALSISLTHIAVQARKVFYLPPRGWMVEGGLIVACDSFATSVARRFVNGPLRLLFVASAATQRFCEVWSRNHLG